MEIPVRNKYNPGMSRDMVKGGPAYKGRTCHRTKNRLKMNQRDKAQLKPQPEVKLHLIHVDRRLKRQYRKV